MTINNKMLWITSRRAAKNNLATVLSHLFLYIEYGGFKRTCTSLTVHHVSIFNFILSMCRKNFDRSFYICALIVALWTSAVVGSLRNKSSKSKVRNVYNVITEHAEDKNIENADFKKILYILCLWYTQAHLNLNEQHYSMIFLASI